MTYMDHAEGQRCLLELADILDGLGLRFFLIQGTALGAYRDGGFTPTEQDIDFGFLHEHFCCSTGVLACELVSEGFDIVTITKPFSCCRTIVAQKCGIKVDLVSYSLWKEKRFASAPIDSVNVPQPYCIVHRHEMLESYDRVELFGRDFNSPRPIEEYLELEYGPDWRTPREDHVSRTRIYGFMEQVIADGFRCP